MFKNFFFNLQAFICPTGASQVVLVVKNPPANAGDERHEGSIPELERSLEEGMATHAGVLA